MISVVIPTRNRSELLGHALDSLTRQELSVDRFEVLVIDNGSTDQTASVVDEYTARLENLRYFHDPEPGLHIGRHRGMTEAKGDVLVFTDDDIEAFPSWLSSIRETFADSNVAMVGGNNLPMFLKPPPAWLKCLWERPTMKHGRALPALSVLELMGGMRELSPYYVWGCNFAIRKDVLLAAGGFHPDGMPKELIRFRGDGETHVSRYVAESGMKCIFHSGASVYHKVMPERMSFAYFRQRGFNQGVSDSYTALRNQDVVGHRDRHHPLKRIAGKIWRRLRDVFWVEPEAKQALSELKFGYHEGYAYHQRIYKEDAEVREWVHKPKYFKERAV